MTKNQRIQSFVLNYFISLDNLQMNVMKNYEI
jgi:hypothetical protein